MENQAFHHFSSSYPRYSGNTDNGNALWFVLIAIGLMGALTMILGRTGSEGAYDDERNAVMASMLQRQSKTIETAVAQLISQGCSINDISFEQTIITSYTNPTTPTDSRCKVFHQAGAGISWYSLPDNAFHGTSPRDRWRYTGANQIKGVGTDCTNSRCSDLVMTAEINATYSGICKKLNELNGISTTTFPTDTDIASGGTARWTGSFAYSASDIIGNEAGGENLIGKKAGCFYDSTDLYYVYYYVLYAQ